MRESGPPLGALRGALWSDTELTVDPRLILASLPAFLEEKYGVQFRFAQQVREIVSTPGCNTVSTAAASWQAETVFVCTLGDSHEYGLSVDPFNKQEIDDLILDYTLGFLKAPDLAIDGAISSIMRGVNWM